MNKVLLVILDGWGWRQEIENNAIAQADTPVFRYLWERFPRTLLHASGEWVNLPEGQIGSSEVGHAIIGAGRNVPQLSTIITQSIKMGNFFTNPALKSAMAHAKTNKTKLHLIGLTSDGGVHSFWEHLSALLRMAKQEEMPSHQVVFHTILDGRDVGPKTGKKYIDKLKAQMHDLGVGRIATVCGRYWIMDRDKRWERTAKAYEALVLGVGHKGRDAAAVIGENYFAGKTDEFIEPTVLMDASGPIGTIQDGDAVIFFNFRADRARQIARALTDPSFREFERKRQVKIHFTCMTPYDSTFNLPVAFTLENTNHHALILPELLEEKGIPQFRIAETEKYAHVTYFFNGGREQSFPHEERAMIPSPKVATYDHTPEMSARLITDKLLERLPKHPFAVCNFSNADMVGHTGVFKAAKAACEFVDGCLKRILERAQELDFYVVVTADHGNAEQMVSAEGEPHTAHTTGPVPFIVWNKNGVQGTLREDSDKSLRDIAPTLLELMDWPKPLPSFEGRSLIRPSK